MVDSHGWYSLVGAGWLFHSRAVGALSKSILCPRSQLHVLGAMSLIFSNSRILFSSSRISWSSSSSILSEGMSVVASSAVSGVRVPSGVVSGSLLAALLLGCITQQCFFDDRDLGVGVEEGGDGVQAVLLLIAGKVVEIVEELGNGAGRASAVGVGWGCWGMRRQLTCCRCRCDRAAGCSRGPSSCAPRGRQ
jgi:hypothetical protein